MDFGTQFETHRQNTQQFKKILNSWTAGNITDGEAMKRLQAVYLEPHSDPEVDITRTVSPAAALENRNSTLPVVDLTKESTPISLGGDESPKESTQLSPELATERAKRRRLMTSKQWGAWKKVELELFGSNSDEE